MNVYLHSTVRKSPSFKAGDRIILACYTKTIPYPLSVPNPLPTPTLYGSIITSFFSFRPPPSSSSSSSQLSLFLPPPSFLPAESVDACIVYSILPLITPVVILFGGRATIWARPFSESPGSAREIEKASSVALFLVNSNLAHPLAFVQIPIRCHSPFCAGCSLPVRPEHS